MTLRSQNWGMTTKIAGNGIFGARIFKISRGGMPPLPSLLGFSSTPGRLHSNFSLLLSALGHFEKAGLVKDN